ncbi:MAG: hypothetical protein JST38_18280 [Bacteroidetes bacterium]|nr:hypothetical protein [Bacteroidota bacterium]
MLYAVHPNCAQYWTKAARSQPLGHLKDIDATFWPQVFDLERKVVLTEQVGHSFAAFAQHLGQVLGIKDQPVGKHPLQMGQNLGWRHLGEDEKKPPENHRKVGFGGFFQPAFAIISNSRALRKACKLLILLNWRKRRDSNPR